MRTYPLSLLHHADGTKPALLVADATSFAIVEVSFKVAIFTPLDCSVGAEEIAKPAPHTHVLIPHGNKCGFLARFKGFCLPFL
jgi:hypothetical protein